MHAFLVCVVDGFLLTMILTNFLALVMGLGVSVSCQASLFPLHAVSVWWCCFSTESLILAQDERWRRA